MKIAIDARMYGNSQCSGIGFYIEQLTDHIFEFDEKNEYVMFMREPEFSKFTPPNERVKKVLVKPRWYSYGEQFSLPIEFAKEKFDLIHYPHFNSPILYPKKSVCTIHDVTPLSFPGHKMKSLFRRMAYRAVFWATLNKSSKIIAVSEATKRGILDNFGIKPEKIKVIHEGTAENFGKEENYGIINKVKSKFGITKPYIFFVGVWRNHKNVEGLVRAFNLLKEKYNIPHQLVLGGREDLHYTDVRREIEKSNYENDIITTGFIDNQDLPSLYQGAEVHVIPAFIEGFGLIAIEAQSCGTAVVSSNTSCLPEVIGGSGLFFDPKDVEDMAGKIYEVLGDEELREGLIRKGFENVERFSWEKAARETVGVYEGVRNNK
jgi:glycosyltransferase involved in cell wall biosynthesis